MSTSVVATAGHVDHGKSTLVRALTGTDPDRLPEEKRRGLTIELGFARLPLNDVDDIHFIDVPGHVRFVGTMLAGVGALDACLLVIAAPEGWMPQTEEHLRILELIGVRRGLVAITMCDLVDSTSLSGVVRDIEAPLSGSFLEEAPRVLVDSVTGRGLSELRDELSALSRAVDPTNLARMRLWIDRSFSMPGAGTVVTGTLTGGPIAVGDTIQASTRRGLHAVRIRGVESFGEASDHLEPGRRAAVSLAGIVHHDLHRGDVLLEPDRWHLSTEVDASLEILSTSRTIRSTGAYVLHLGTDEQPVRLSLLGTRTILPGATGLTRLRFPRPVPLVPGDRFVLRDSGSSTTVGGGEILDVAPILRPSKARPDRDVRRVLAERGWIEADELERLTGTRIEPVLGVWAVDSGTLEELRDEVRRRASDAGALGLDVARLDDRERAIAVSDDELVIRAGRLHPLDVRDAFDGHPYLEKLNAALFDPPSAAEAGVPIEEVKELVRRHLAVQEDGIVFSAAALPAAAAVAADLLVASPQGFTVGELRTRLRTSRRFAVALLGWLDSEGVTRRRGDLRIGGPRLPPPNGREG